MPHLKTGAGRWIVPTVLTAVVVAAVAIAPAFGGSNTVTTKKVKKITTSKINANNALTHATELRVIGPKHSGNTFNMDAPDSLIARQSGLPAGNYVVSTTFTLDTGGTIVACQLRAGTNGDTANSSGGQPQDTVSMSVTTAIPAGGTVELRCIDGSVTDSREDNIEITALRVPDITRQTG
jgi:hypothetical protein